MNINAPSRSSQDVMASRLRMIVFYVLPGIAIFVSGNFRGGEFARIVWPLAFLVMGLACVSNAWRCRRVHCFFTGPLFLLASALSALHGWHVMNLGPRGWEIIGYGTLLLTFALYYAPEALWGKYHDPARGSSPR